MQYLLTLNNGSDLFHINLESEHHIFLDYPMNLVKIMGKYSNAVWLPSLHKFLTDSVNDLLDVEQIVFPTCTLIDIIPFNNIVDAKI